MLAGCSFSGAGSAASVAAAAPANNDSDDPVIGIQLLASRYDFHVSCLCLIFVLTTDQQRENEEALRISF